jgi:hypothetical protein
MKITSAAVLALLSATGCVAFMPASIPTSKKAAFYRSPLAASSTFTRLAMSTEAEAVPVEAEATKETFEFTVRFC